MKRYALSLLIVCLAALSASAHFIWIVPDGAEGTKAQVVFSDSLEPDDGVPIEKIAATKLFVRDASGKAALLDWKKGENAYLVTVPGTGPSIVGGVCIYGVSTRGQGKPFLLAYYPKLVRGEATDAKAAEPLPLEIVSRGAGRFQVLRGGKPSAGDEVVVMPPAPAAKETLTTDAQGEVQVRATAAGLYGIRARHIEAKTGEHDGKKYEEVRHYATLVYRASEKGARAGTSVPAPLPVAVSSFGAAVAGGWVYVYGGHSARTHQYSTESVVGTFRRLRLSDPKAWEDLPSGPGLQGLAVVAHRGKIYRIGGMQPRNQPGTRADNHSVATCACYDPATGKWESLPDLPTARSSHDAVILGDRIYVAGGWKMNGAGQKAEWHDTALVLDLASKPSRWQSFAQPFHRRALTTAAHDGKLYVIAGLTDENEMELAVDIYDPATGQWTSGKEIPGPIGNGFTPASCVAGGRLFVSTADGKLWRFTEKGDAWEQVGTLERPRIVHRLVAARDDLLFAIGGASRAGNVALTEAIEPACCSVKPATATSAAANPGGQACCPIMTTVPVDSDSRIVEYKGVKVLLCCSACVRKWNADPEAYLDMKRLPQLAKVELPVRSLKQVFCPVYRDRVVSEKDPFVMYKGQKVHLFNQNAVRRWEQAPEKYADPTILPQLAAR